MQEEATQGVTIERCDNCRIVVTAQGIIRWSCDDRHPEVFAWLEAQEHATTPGDTDNEQSYQRKRLRPYRK